MKLMRINRPDFWSVSPFEQMNSLREEINHLFDSPSGESTRSGEFFNDWAPPLDLREDENHLFATVELPGLKKDDIDVSVHDGVLSVSGERTREEKVDQSGTHRCERHYGRFHRTVTLPKPVKVDEIGAAYKDGILTIEMPKTEEAKPKQIEVSVG